jgi:hypothetical protein
VDARDVDAGLEPLGVAQLLGPFNRLGVPAADRDVTRGVLVEQAVAEDEITPADAGVAVDEPNLAEIAGAVVRLDLRADEVLASGGGDTDDPPRLELQFDVLGDRASTAASSSGRRPRCAVGPES